VEFPFWKVDVTYTNPAIEFGPLSFGLSELPSEVNAHFQFDSSQLPALGEDVQVSHVWPTASLVFGDADLTLTDLFFTEDDVSVLPNFRIGLDTSGEISLLQYAFGPVINTVTETGGIVLNSSFELNITGTDIASGDAFHYNYQTSTQTITQVTGPFTISFDIKPLSCPNPLNVKSKGVLPVAILGTAGFNVRLIDIATLELNGVAPVRSGFEDVTTPTGLEPCECLELSGDGSEDLTLKFDRQAIIEAIIATYGAVENGDEIPLMLTGMLQDGTTEIQGSDCVVIKDNRKVDSGNKKKKKKKK
jgi:hypothetical protein